MDKRRFANHVNKKEEVLEVKQKMKSIKKSDFVGDIFLNYFLKVNRPSFLENGLCVIDVNYKWLQFYDYSSKVCLTAIYDDRNQIVEWYFDIARKIGKEDGMPYEDDMYLDVLVKSNGEIILLDKDELQEAFEKDMITKEEYDEAYGVANDLIKRLKENINKLKEFTDRYLKEMLYKEDKTCPNS